MDHGFLLTLSIHRAEIPTNPQNFANTLGLKWTHKLRLRLKPKTRKYMQSWEHLKLKSWALTFEVDFNFDEMSKSAGLENYINSGLCHPLSSAHLTISKSQCQFHFNHDNHGQIATFLTLFKKDLSFKRGGHEWEEDRDMCGVKSILLTSWMKQNIKICQRPNYKLPVDNI